MENLTKQVEQWSIDKGLDEADSRGQFLKIVEETGEVAAALARSDMDALKDGIGDVVVTLIIYAQQTSTKINLSLKNEDYLEFVDKKHDSYYLSELISIIGTLIHNSDSSLEVRLDACAKYLLVIAIRNDLNLEECLQAAYDEISGRTGKMVNGIFVKTEDLPKSKYSEDDWKK